MAVETKADLNKKTIEKLQKLIRANIDSHEGFQKAAEEVEDQNIAGLFRNLAEQRSQFASELQNYVEWNGEEARNDGSVAAQVHRVWMNVRSKLSGGDAYAILAEAEFGEDHIKEAYEEVLEETAGSAMNDVLSHQFAQIKSGHDRVRDLRDEYKAKS